MGGADRSERPSLPYWGGGCCRTIRKVSVYPSIEGASASLLPCDGLVFLTTTYDQTQRRIHLIPPGRCHLHHCAASDFLCRCRHARQPHLAAADMRASSPYLHARRIRR